MLSIARAFGLTAKQLGWYNPKAARLKSGNLAAGQTIFVPTLETAHAAADVPNPSLERYPHRSKAPAKKPAVASAGKDVKKPGDGTKRKSTR
jgi:hypothetical protein